MTFLNNNLYHRDTNNRRKVYPCGGISLFVILSHHLPKQKHFIVLMPVPYLFFRYGWTMKMLVPELHDVEPAAVHIKMDVALFEIRSAGFPNDDFRMQLLDEAPGRVTYAFAMDFWVDEEQLQLTAKKSHVDRNNRTADFFSVKEDAVGFGVLTVNGSLNRGA